MIQREDYYLRLWCINEIADYLRLDGTRQIRNYMKRGYIPYYKIGKRTLRFSKREIETWLMQHYSGAYKPAKNV